MNYVQDTLLGPFLPHLPFLLVRTAGFELWLDRLKCLCSATTGPWEHGNMGIQGSTNDERESSIINMDRLR